MKIPDQFIIRISANSSGRKIKCLKQILSKDLLEKEPIEFSYAKSIHSGGRYASENKFKVRVQERRNWEKELVEINIYFTRQND